MAAEGRDEDSHCSILFSITIYGVACSTAQGVKSGLRVQGGKFTPYHGTM